MKKYFRYLITLKYVKLFAYRSAKYLQKSIIININKQIEKLKKLIIKYEESLKNESHKKRYVYYYGFQAVYGTINKCLMLLILGLILGILPELFIVTFSFVILRVWVGGLHFDSYTLCAWISLLSLTVMGLCAKYYTLNSITVWIIYITALILYLKYAPIEHKNKPLTEQKKKKYKVTAVILLFMIFIFNLYYINPLWNNSTIYGILLTIIIILPSLVKNKSKQLH